MIRTGIVGCGKVARYHAAALVNLEGSDLRAVCSRSPEKATVFGKAYGAKGYDDVASMVVHEQLDMVIVCTPHPNHKDPALDAMKAGAHVLVEKPMASSLEDCDAMIKASENYGKILGVVSQRRFYPPVQRVKKAIDSGKIGNPVLGTVTMLSWRDENYYLSDPWRGRWKEEGGGVLVNQAPHQLDLLLWFMGDIEELYGVHANLNHPYIEVEDTALAIIKFKNGALGNIVVSNSQKPGIFGKVHVHGSNGATAGVQTEGGAMFVAGMTEKIDPPYNDIWTVPGEEKMVEEWREEDSRFFNSTDSIGYFLERQVEDFILAVEEGKEPMVPAREGRKTVELFRMIYRSHQTGKPVKPGDLTNA
jgi:predicted dehydrogenase